MCVDPCSFRCTYQRTNPVIKVIRFDKCRIERYVEDISAYTIHFTNTLRSVQSAYSVTFVRLFVGNDGF